MSSRWRLPVIRSGAAVGELIDLVAGRRCGGCDLPGVRWCSRCATELVLDVGPARRLPGGLVVHHAAWYAGVARTAINRWKDDGRPDLTGVLAGALAGPLRDCLGRCQLNPPEDVWLIPVPSSMSARRRRGYEPVRALARSAARSLARSVACSAARPTAGPASGSTVGPAAGRGYEVGPTAGRGYEWGALGARGGRGAHAVPALRQVRPVVDQAGLGIHDRRRNLEGALIVRAGWGRSVIERPVVLVDDVVTTGATLIEAARALQDAGAWVLGAVAVASAARRSAPGSSGVRHPAQG
ncbi:MAG: ComF family protein [Angustibacter sp.]